MELTRPPMSETARNRLEQGLYPQGNRDLKDIQAWPENRSRAGCKNGQTCALHQEGAELDISAERLRDAETSNGWATRQVRTLHKEMRRCRLFLPQVNIFSHTSFSIRVIELDTGGFQQALKR